MSSVADRLRELMAVEELSARQLSLGAGLGHSTVSKILRSLDTDPSYQPDLATLRSLAARYKVRLSWLTDGAGAMRGEDDGADAGPELGDFRPEPVLGALPNWKALCAAALDLDPGVRPWSLSFLATRSPMLVGELTPLALVELARVVQRHMLPPSEPGAELVAKPRRRSEQAETPLEKIAKKEA